MNRNKIKTYAQQARRDFIKAVTDRAAYYGLTKDNSYPITEQGDIAIIAGRPFPRAVAEKRRRLEERVTRQGFDQVMEAIAYTWFNRFVAIRYMELHGYLDHGYRVLSTTNHTNDTNKGKNVSRDYSVIWLPEILVYAEHMDLPGVDREKVVELKLAGNRDEELYRMLLIAQCNALHKAMPFLFEWVDDETELLLPENLLHSDSLIRKLMNEIPEEDWGQVEIIGWLYQFYISEKMDQIIGKVVKSEDIPAATQPFTPNWIVKYMVQNTLGRQWLATYPHSPLRSWMEFYIDPADQTPEVQVQLKAIRPESLNPEELTLLDSACGSGHILVEAYDLLKAIYQERGYRAKDIPRLILEKNLFGLEIDDRAAQLAAFALMMKARSDDRRIFDSGVKPHVLAIQNSPDLSDEALGLLTTNYTNHTNEGKKRTFMGIRDMRGLLELFVHGKAFGSLIRVPEELAKKLAGIMERVEDVLAHGDMFGKAAAEAMMPVVKQAQVLEGKYDGVVTNPPYMGSKGMNGALKAFAQDNYPDSKSDLFAMFIERGLEMVPNQGYSAMVTMQSWMFLSSYEKLRQRLLAQASIECMSHMANMVMGIAFGTSATVWRNAVDLNSEGAFCYVEYEDIGDGNKPVAFPPQNEQNKAAPKFSPPTAFFRASAADFKKIPGNPIAYWISNYEVFVGDKLCDIAVSGGRCKTHGDDRYIRMLWEVDLELIGKENKWKKFDKGGDFKKFYANQLYVVDWSVDAKSFYASHGGLSNSKFWNKEGITWPTLTSSISSFRIKTDDSEYGSVSPTIFFRDFKCSNLILGLLNTKVANYFLKVINPTLALNVGDLLKLPLPNKNIDSNFVSYRVNELLRLSKLDWDSYETSWDFKSLALLDFRFLKSDCGLEENGNNQKSAIKNQKLTQAYARLRARWREMTLEMQRLEEENNHIFIEAYGLQDELTPDVPLNEITLTCNPHYRYGGDKSEEELEALLQADTMKELVSYAIGCMMGRYSLDAPGLIYAHSGNDQFWEIYHEKHNQPTPAQEKNHSCNSCDSWLRFRPDEDGIIPITETEWFADDVANRVVEFIGVAWPKEHLDENLKFITENLGSNRGESPRETIRRYLATGFFKHHLSMYKKRPIYWLFCSGKQRAFQCLVYLHRYNEGTLSRMRTDYVIPLQGKISARTDQLKDDIAGASSTSHRKRLEKEREKLVKQQAELRTFDEKLRHFADQRVSLDLDDGVKVNYAKFGDLLAEVKAVTGKQEE